MKKLLILLSIAVTLTACTSFKKLPSVCDTLTGPSYLCEIAGKHGVRLESVGATIVLANAIAIAEGAYTTHDAVKVLKELRSALDGPVSYIFFKSHVESALRKYPGLLLVADFYIQDMNLTRIMYASDRAMLRDWLSARISGLEAFI